LRLDVLAAPTDSRAVLDRSWGWSAIAWDPSHEARLRAALGSGSVRVFIGDAASLVTLSEHRDPGADVVEVMAHGFYEPLSEPPAGVALAECPGSDGLVHATDLLDIASGRLTVLAVCGAGRTPLRSGDDGVSNLSGAFLRAGAQCIVLSPVDLDQSATEELLLEFYGKLAQGRSPAEAMLSARRKLSKSERFADPFYHSMLQVVGLGFRPLVQPALAEERATSRWHLPLLAAAAVLLIGVITWRLVVRSHRARTRTESSATA
jgi:hypothetical protein